jgi:hypothetical protein
MKEEYEKLVEAGMPDNHYVKEWLSFVLLAKPAEDKALASFISGKRKIGFSLADVTDLREYESKRGRRAIDAENNGSTGGSNGSKEGGSNTKAQNIIITHHHEGIGGTAPSASNVALNRVQKLIKAVREQLEHVKYMMELKVNIAGEDMNTTYVKLLIQLNTLLSQQTTLIQVDDDGNDAAVNLDSNFDTPL